MLAKLHFAQMQGEEILFLIANMAAFAQILPTNYHEFAIFPVNAFLNPHWY